MRFRRMPLFSRYKLNKTVSRGKTCQSASTDRWKKINKADNVDKLVKVDKPET